jgi:hypothetical protein
MQFARIDIRNQLRQCVLVGEKSQLHQQCRLLVVVGEIACLQQVTPRRSAV